MRGTRALADCVACSGGASSRESQCQHSGMLIIGRYRTSARSFRLTRSHCDIRYMASSRSSLRDFGIFNTHKRARAKAKFVFQREGKRVGAAADAGCFAL